LVQPARDLRAGARAGARAAGRVGGEHLRRVDRPGRGGLRDGRLAPLLRPDRARLVVRQQRELPEQHGQARGSGARDDPPRHAAQAHGARPAHSAGRLMDVSEHPSIEDLCIAADALVTDYSSIMFDYAVLDRPIVIHAPDWDEYRTKRGVYFDLMEERPGPVTSSEGELVEALRA